MGQFGVKRQASIVISVITFLLAVTALPLSARAEDMTARDPRDMLAAVNAARAEAGLSALTLNARLAAAACRQARDLSGRALHDVDALGHQGSDGSTLATRLRDAGYGYRSAAENLAAGVADPQAVVRLWMTSDGHRRNMMDPGLREMGAAFLGARLSPGGNRTGPMDVWVLVLASPNGAAETAQEAKNPNDCAG